MKKISLAILTLLVVLTACKKVPEVNKEYVDVERELIVIDITTASIQCEYEYIATLKKAYLYYGKDRDVSNMTAAEMHVEQNTLYVDLKGLERNTTYAYYFEFHNGFNSMRTELKTFKTKEALFTVDDKGDQVVFSQGNLQYQASTDTWRFAENQWSFVGGVDTITGEELGNVYDNGIKSDNALISSTYGGWIDLFGWGTSGYNHGSICYQPWSISVDYSDYYAYGTLGCNLYDQTRKADWGYNAIINGGNTESIGWRTLTYQEWGFLLFSRATLSDMRFAKGTVNGVAGIILLPDDWVAGIYELNDADMANASFTSNVIALSVWNDIFEAHGAVFLPVSGVRYRNAFYASDEGHYWSSSSYNDEKGAYDMDFTSNAVETDYYGTLYFGHIVRLVKDYH